MRKKIIVQEGLNDLKNSLDNLGYEVVDINDSSSAEAIIYMADGYDVGYHNNLASMNSGIDISNNRGTILINAAGKTTEEINNIIKNRIYSPLFDWQQIRLIGCQSFFLLKKLPKRGNKSWRDNISHFHNCTQPSILQNHVFHKSAYINNTGYMYIPYMR